LQLPSHRRNRRTAHRACGVCYWWCVGIWGVPNVLEYVFSVAAEFILRVYVRQLLDNPGG
jgi:hypothetical protein